MSLYSLSQVPGAGTDPLRRDLAAFFASQRARMPFVAVTLSSGNNNDYGLNNSEALRVTANASGSTLTGLAAGVDGQLLLIVCVSNTLTIAHESASSSANNRFTSVNGANIVLAAGEMAGAVYDAAASRWRVWRLGESSGAEKHSCHVYNSSAQTHTGGATTVLTFNSEEWDVGGLHDTSTNTGRITIPSADIDGVWLFYGQVRFTARASNDVPVLSLRRNGTTIVARGHENSVPTGQSDDFIYRVTRLIRNPTAADYFEMIYNGGTGRTTDPGVEDTFFSCVRIGTD